MHAADEPAPASVLFVCTRNAIRSPMAAELMRMRFGPLVRVESAGVRPAGAVDPLAALVLDELGADIAAYRPKGLGAFEEEPPFGIVVSLSPEAHHIALDRVPRLGLGEEYWAIFDPSLAEGSREQRLMEYRLVRDGLDAKIARRFARPSTG